MRDNWFAKVPAWVFLDEGLGRKEKYVYTALTLFADSKGRCFPSIQRLSEICSYSRASVFEALKKLEENGVILRKQRYHKNEQISTLYSLAKKRYEPPEPPPPVQPLDPSRPAIGLPPSNNWTPPVQPLDTEQSQLTLPVNRASEQQNENENRARANFSEKEGEKIGNTRQREVQENDGRISTDVWQAFGKRRNG